MSELLTYAVRTRTLDEVTDEISPLAYTSVAVLIFLCVSLTFFFPVNPLIPLDRRTCAVIGATTCYLSRVILFPSNRMDLVEAIDFDVLVLLAGIMVVNFVVVHQRETKKAILWIQNLIKLDPRKGFWTVSVLVFLTAPFLTNDGVCLLFVEPIMDAFSGLMFDPVPHVSSSNMSDATLILDLRKGDAFYFVMSLACSSNIGSALTYTGNPQNMMVAEDSIGVLPPTEFLFHMMLPTIFSWVITTLWIERCWFRNRECIQRKPMQLLGDGTDDQGCLDVYSCRRDPTIVESSGSLQKRYGGDVSPGTFCDVAASPFQPRPPFGSPSRRRFEAIGSPLRSLRSLSDGDLQHYTRDEDHPSPDSIVSKIIYVIASPFPYAMCFLLSAMIALIFADLISIAGLIVCAAVIMVAFTVLGNHWRGKAIWGPEDDVSLLTSDEKKKNTNEFFERLFSSLDYSLLILFAGLFVVLENISSTGIPSYVWSKIVGETPFKSVSSVVGICLFVLLSSQFLGNVPVIQLAKPNVEYLDDDDKRYAWAILSFVATIGGNLTITGSAANIIVAEKVNKLDPASCMNFFSHFKVCFWVTMVSCIVGVSVISCTLKLQELSGY